MIKNKPKNTSNLFNTLLQLFGITITTAAIVAFTLYTWDAELKKQKQNVLNNFQQVSSTYINLITTKIDVTMEVLPTAALYSKILGEYTQDNFYDFSQGLFDRYADIAALGWAPVVRSGELKAFEDRRSEEGYPGYKVAPYAGESLPATDFYLPIKYQEFNREHDFRENDSRLMGLDFRSFKPWSRALEIAVENNEITFTIDTTEPYRLLALYPVYKAGSNITTKGQRFGNLDGYIIAQLDPKKAVESAISKVDSALANMNSISILDNSGFDIISTRIYEDEEFDSLFNAELNSSREISIYNRSWIVQFRPTAAFLDTVQTSDIATWILGSGLTLAAFTFLALLSLVTRNKRIEREVKLRTSELVEANVQIRESEALLMQSEKMSSLGQMVAGVAHELNTPLGYVRSNLEVIHDHFGDLGTLLDKVMSNQTKRPDGSNSPILGLFKRLDDEIDPETMVRVCKDSLDGVDHLSNIVTTLKSFSRMDQVAFESNSLVQCMESSLMIAHNQLKHKVEVHKYFEETPNVLCNASEINQVLLNLLINASDSIQDAGTIDIKIGPAEGGATISIIDSGEGIPDDIKNRIFDPFYTTKDVGKGTGLGLFICNRIITNHGGHIDIISALGQGTEFKIFLPLKPPTTAKAA